MAEVGGATKFIFAGDDQGFKVGADQIDSLTLNQLVILNSPSNPTGCLYSREEMEEIVELACKKDFLLMSDEIYEYLLYDGVEHHRPASFGEDAANRVITVSGFSKTFSMTGWRLGTLVANPIIAKAVASYKPRLPPMQLPLPNMGLWLRLKLGSVRLIVSEMLVHFDRPTKIIKFTRN